MTSGGGSREASTIQPTKVASARPLWEQPSFLVTFGLCVAWLAVLIAGSETRPGARPGAVILLILTVIGYAVYRRRRGWKALPTSGWLPSRQTSRKRAIGLGAYMAVLVLLVAGVALPQKAGPSPRATSGGGSAGLTGCGSTRSCASYHPDGDYHQTWSKDYGATTCGDWVTAMDDRQRFVFAADVLLVVRKRADPNAGIASDNDVNDLTDAITAACADNGAGASALDNAQTEAETWFMKPR